MDLDKTGSHTDKSEDTPAGQNAVKIGVYNTTTGKKVRSSGSQQRLVCSIAGCTTLARNYKSGLCIKHATSQRCDSGLPGLESEQEVATATVGVVVSTTSPSASTSIEHRDGKKFKRSAGRTRRLCDALECTKEAERPDGETRRLCVKHSKQLAASVLAMQPPEFLLIDESVKPILTDAVVSVDNETPEALGDAAFQTHMEFNACLNDSIVAETFDQSRNFLSMSHGADSLLMSFTNNNPTVFLQQDLPLSEQDNHLWELFHTMVLPHMWSKKIKSSNGAVVIYFGLDHDPNGPIHEQTLPLPIELVIGSDGRHALCVNGKPVIPTLSTVTLPKLIRPFTRENVAEVLASLAYLYAPCSNSKMDNGKCELIVRNTRSVCPSCRKQQRALRRRIHAADPQPKSRQNHGTMTKEHVLWKYRAEVKKRTALEKELLSVLHKRDEQEKEIAYLTEQLGRTDSQENHMEEPFRTLMKQMKAMYACNKYGRRYDPQFKELCAEIYHYGPRTYRMLRDKFKFPLPSERTINEMLAEFNSESGLHESLLDAIKERCLGLSKSRSQWALVFDEMALSENVSYDFHNNRIEGLVDYGEFQHLLTTVETRETAKHALVFMLLNTRTKQLQPLCFYFTGHSAKSNILSHMITGIMERLIDKGLDVLCTVCDASTSNQSAMHRLGVRIRVNRNNLRMVNYFVVRGKRILVLFDTPHLLKCCRNQFVSHDWWTFCNAAGEVYEHKASVDHIRELINHENSKEQCGLKGTFQLTEDLHTRPNNWQKMRVKYAAQLFSQSTATALEESEFDFTETTRQLCLFVNELFDLMNSYSTSINPQKKPVEIENLDEPESSSPQLSRLRAMQNHLIQWHRTVPQSERLKNETLGRWILSIESLIELCVILIKDCEFDYVMTRKISQDRLENFFGIIGGMCGSTRNPTTSGFRYAFRRQLRHISFEWAPKCGNASVEDVDDDVEAVVADHEPVLRLMLPEECTYCLPDEYCFLGSSLSIEQQNQIYYIAGVAVRYLRRLRPRALVHVFLTSMDEVQKCAIHAARYTQKRNFRNLLFVKPIVSEYFFDLEHAFQTILFRVPADRQQRIIAMPEICSSLASSLAVQQRQVDLVKALDCSSSVYTVTQLEAAMKTVTFRYLKIRAKRLVEQFQRYRTGFAESDADPETV